MNKFSTTKARLAAAFAAMAFVGSIAVGAAPPALACKPIVPEIEVDIGPNGLPQRVEITGWRCL